MQQAVSYRDRDGFMVQRPSGWRRYVGFSYAERYQQLMRSGLYQKLVTEGLLIPHVELDMDETEKNRFYRILVPERIPFISLPYEWTAEQWKEATLTFLRINTLCMEQGMILKDATPFNLTFYQGHCVFFDTLSFDTYTDGDPWIAYRQFCEMMLGPVSLMYFNDTDWGRLTVSQINGLSLAFISSHLPLQSWCNPVLLLHIHLHARAKKSRAASTKKTFTREKLLVLWDLIHKSVAQWKTRERAVVWSNYYDTTILSDTYLESKTKILSNWLSTINCTNVVDIGSNDGHFTLLASDYAQQVIAVESDHGCVEKLRDAINKKQLTHIETVVADIAAPTPAIGWENEERSSLLQRLSGDMVLMLAVIHHLCIGANIPMAFVARLAARITTRYAIVEFVPRTDPKVAEMLRYRKDIFDDYQEAHFQASFGQYFTLVDVADCTTTDRKLYLWEKL